jgi:hypothetical protein
MRSVTYSMSVSLDGYIVGPDGDFDWTAPDEEVFRLSYRLHPDGRVPAAAWAWHETDKGAEKSG